MSLLRSLELWIEVTGVDPSQKSYSFGDFSILQMHQSIKEALELDDTEITGKLLFEYLATQYFQERSFSVEELLSQPENVSQYLAKSKELLSYLRSEELVAMSNNFMSQMQKAASYYGALGKEVDEMLQNRHHLAILRRDAMRTLQNLSINQFLAGTPEAANVKPVYGKYIYRWNNINSMLKMVTRMPSGVTINLIANESDPFRSYFVFAIRNGANVFVFTDKEKTPHPMAEDLYHRMDKVLAERAARNWFPYELMGLAFDEETGKAYIKTSDRTGVVPYQSEVQPLKAIAELSAPSFLWITMMLDLIMQKFWNEHYQAPALSYTGEMIKVELPLLEAAQEANLPVIGYQPLSFKPLTVADVQDEEKQDTYVGKKGFGVNKWLEERYGHLVADETINVISTPNKPLALEFNTGNGTQALIPASTNADKKLPFWELEKVNKNRLQIDHLDATSFGTREELEKDRLFVARSNYAKQVFKLANDEFEERKKDVITWVKNKVENNLDKLYPLMAQDTVLLPCEKLDTFDQGAYCWHGETQDGYKRQFMVKQGLTGENEDRKKSSYGFYGEGKFVFSGGEHKQGCPTCFQTNAPAAFTVRFFPETVEDLAFLCDCKVEELPDVLQHWTMRKPHVGNHILRRIDPMEWQCENPWSNLFFELTFFISSRANSTLKKKYGEN